MHATNPLTVVSIKAFIYSTSYLLFNELVQLLNSAIKYQFTKKLVILTFGNIGIRYRYIHFKTQNPKK